MVVKQPRSVFFWQRFNVHRQDLIFHPFHMGFPEIGVSPDHPLVAGISSYKPSSYGGTPKSWKAPNRRAPRLRSARRHSPFASRFSPQLATGPAAATGGCLRLLLPWLPGALVRTVSKWPGCLMCVIMCHIMIHCKYINTR